MNASYRITLVGAVANLLLAFFKMALGIWGRSQAVVADGVHSLSDLFTDALAFVGLRYSSRPPDECHPYGHRRIETLLSVAIGIVLGLTAFGMIYEAVSSLRNLGVRGEVKAAVVLAPLVSILVKEALFRATLSVGRREGSPAVVANAYHHRSDALSSVPALLGAGLSSFFPSLSFCDPLGSIVVSGLILKSAWDIVKSGAEELCDKSDVEEAKRIEREVLKVSGVKDAHRVRARKHGGRILVDLHILVDPSLSVREGHEISEEVKRFLLRRYERIVDVVVHLEPYEEDLSQEASSSPCRREGEGEGETPSDRPEDRN